MPAGLPGSTVAENAANPSAGRAVIFDLFSGPKGSPFDRAGSSQSSTGALNTGIGFGSPPIFGPTAPQSLRDAGFNDNYVPGVTMPDGTAVSANSKLMYIGGGRMSNTVNADGTRTPNPYATGFGIGMAGNGGSRDAGAGPAFTGFLTKTVTATGAVANGAAVEAGWTNRSGAALTTGQSVFGSSTSASAAVA